MNHPYICRSNLIEMGADVRNNLIQDFYQCFLRQMLREARNGKFFTRYIVAGENWAIVNALSEKIVAEHPGVDVKNRRSEIPGLESEIEVRWD